MAGSSGEGFSYDAYISGLIAKSGNGGAIGPGAANDNLAGFIGKEEFFNVFQFAFMMGHNVSGLQSLDIGGNGTARPASDALYDICFETPSLHFLIKPGGKWVERGLAIGMFAIPIAKGVRGELMERKRAKMEGPDVPPDPPPGQKMTKAPKPMNDNNDLMKEFENAAR